MHSISHNYSNKVDFANTLRGIAAFCVLIGHYFGVFWIKRTTVSTLINAPALPLATHATPIYVSWLQHCSFFNWGSYGVALFFIISGFVIPFSLQKGSRFEFCVSRIFRIMPLYAVGFSVTLLALFLSTVYFNTNWPYTGKELFIHYIPGIRDILWSRNIDGIIWTLEIEMKFYLVCVLSINIIRNYSQKVFLIPILFFLFAYYCIQHLAYWKGSDIFAWHLARTYIMSSQFIIFMFIGVIFHYLFCKKIELDKGYLGIAFLFVLFCINWWIGPYSANFKVVWNYGFALLTFMFAYSYPKVFKGNRIFNFFADISYPLYVIHGLAGYVLLRILLDLKCAIWIALIFVMFSAIFISWILHKFIEKPTQKMGKKVSNLLIPWILSSFVIKKFNAWFISEKNVNSMENL